MRILTLSQWYPPEPDIKIHLLAKDLTARGHQVTSVTGYPNYPQGNIYPGYHQRLWQWEMRNGVRVLRLPLYPSHDRSAVRRSLNYLSFGVSASVLGPLLSGPAEVMWVYHPPLTVGLPAWWIGLIRRVPFVYEIQDLWPESLTATGLVRPSSPIVSSLGRLAQFVYRRAAALTVISPGFKQNLVAKGVPADKIHVIPNWADEEVYRPLPRNDALAAQYGLADRFNILYAGNLGAAQALDNVLDAARRLADLSRVQFVLMGDGVEAERLKRRVSQEGLTNVRFLVRQPAERMAEFMALADVVLVHLRRDPLFAITIPGKTTAYLACGRPILCAVAGDTAAMVQQAGAGLTCPPEDPDALGRRVREFQALSREQREAMGQAGRRAFLANYTRAVLLDRYEALLTRVAQSGSLERTSP